MPGGFFISFEGPEGAGKSTQARLLADYLRAGKGYRVVETREPGGTELGEELRRLVKQVGGGVAPCAEAELFIMAASRAQLVDQVILPALERGEVVICDRFADSTTVYQGFARKLDLECIGILHQVATRNRWPDLTLLLDLDIDEGLRRGRIRDAASGFSDRFEMEPQAFHRLVRDGFRQLAKAEPGRIKVIGADASAASVQALIREVVDRVLG